MTVVEALRHMATYFPVYSYLAKHEGSAPYKAIKKYLMENLDMPESTARLYITTIRNGNSGLIWVDEDLGTFNFNMESVLSFEEILQNLFKWDTYDDRYYEIENLKTEIFKLKHGL